MNLRTLEDVPYPRLHQAFLAAFADYAVPLALTELQLAEMHRRRGVRLDLSVGVFDGDAIAGFTFNGFGPWGGASAGYDSGTGVLPSARGKRLAALMMERSLELLGAAGATRYVLEVLQGNATAFRVYEGIGFRVTREFLCWSLDVVRPRSAAAFAIARASSIDDVQVSGMRDWMPSWQHSDASLARAGEKKTILVARDGDDVAGYLAVFASGDVAQFAVSRAHRRRGIATALVRAARDLSPCPLRIVNIDAGDSGTRRFLEAVGAIETVRQYEMVLELPAPVAGPSTPAP
jgi:ribosomal protein S18 acetylase RimI-like enzyme